MKCPLSPPVCIISRDVSRVFEECSRKARKEKDPKIWKWVEEYEEMKEEYGVEIVYYQEGEKKEEEEEEERLARCFQILLEGSDGLKEVGRAA